MTKNNYKYFEIMNAAAMKAESINPNGTFVFRDINIPKLLKKDAQKNNITFDEASAAIDPENEHELQKAFSNLMKDKTTVFISHRLGSTKLADEILVIDKGKIAERGNHSELMKLNGIYAKMFEVQRSWYQ